MIVFVNITIKEVVFHFIAMLLVFFNLNQVCLQLPSDQVTNLKVCGFVSGLGKFYETDSSRYC